MPKKHISVKMEEAFLEACRNAAWWAGRGTTFNSILEGGARKELEALEKANGGSFPDRPDDARPKRGGERQEGEKVLTTFKMDEELLERLRNAAYALDWPYGQIIEEGARKELARLEKQFNKGKPFKGREGELQDK